MSYTDSLSIPWYAKAFEYVANRGYETLAEIGGEKTPIIDIVDNQATGSFEVIDYRLDELVIGNIATNELAAAFARLYFINLLARAIGEMTDDEFDAIDWRMTGFKPLQESDELNGLSLTWRNNHLKLIYASSVVNQVLAHVYDKPTSNDPLGPTVIAGIQFPAFPSIKA